MQAPEQASEGFPLSPRTPRELLNHAQPRSITLNYAQLRSITLNHAQSRYIPPNTTLHLQHQKNEFDGYNSTQIYSAGSLASSNRTDISPIAHNNTPHIKRTERQWHAHNRLLRPHISVYWVPLMNLNPSPHVCNEAYIELGSLFLISSSVTSPFWVHSRRGVFI